ncbi:hypothetical protein L596_022449 [Steinernema carpocapsae]|uniref:Lipoprotein n=1 Tax=Steinernema carpocapsae TaxID=34508 RepID=A0A4U5MLS8_STECR|nr:hypothetical protein L596_022449 [Steinernema carpocapsae]
MPFHINFKLLCLLISLSSCQHYYYNQAQPYHPYNNYPYSPYYAQQYNQPYWSHVGNGWYSHYYSTPTASRGPYLFHRPFVGTVLTSPFGGALLIG